MFDFEEERKSDATSPRGSRPPTFARLAHRMDAPVPVPVLPGPVPVPSPSLKALGKRRLIEPDVVAVAGVVLKAKAVDEGEKRVTRSSLGGAGDAPGLPRDDGASAWAALSATRC